MPRIPRSQLPSPAWYHVICRGVEQRPIVLDDLDREAWFKLFLDVERRFGWRVHAWCLLDNHFHLLVETTQPELSRGMQRLNGVYAMRFNRRYDRSGHLFQGRFESRVIEGDEYLDTVARVHLRELDAGRAARLAVAWHRLCRRHRRPLAPTPRDYACPRA